jgi:polyferredoxin
LPLGVCAFSLFVRFFLPQATLLVLLAVAVIPLLSALFRCAMGEREIRRNCQGELPFLRQIALAAAIVLLLIFEVAVSGMSFAKDVRPIEMLITAGIYVLYLAIITLAFLPRRATYT